MTREERIAEIATKLRGITITAESTDPDLLAIISRLVDYTNSMGGELLSIIDAGDEHQRALESQLAEAKGHVRALYRAIEDNEDHTMLDGECDTCTALAAAQAWLNRMDG